MLNRENKHLPAGEQRFIFGINEEFSFSRGTKLLGRWPVTINAILQNSAVNCAESEHSFFFQLQNGGGGAGHQELLVAALGADREGGGGMEHGAGAGAGYGFEPHHGYRPHSHSTSVV